MSGVNVVSVIIPVRDRECLVERAVRSVLSQEGVALDVIVVDDGSTDGTADVVRAIAAVDRRVRLVSHERSRGAQAARNTGIREAHGEWIAFLDSDDEFLPGSLASRLALARKTGAGVVHSECLVIDSEGASPVPFCVPPIRGDVRRALLRLPGPVFPGMLTTRRALESIGFLDESIVAYQEWDTAIRLAEGNRFEFLSEPTFIYHRHEGATISKDAARSAAGYAQVVRKHRDAIVRLLGRAAFADHLERLALFHHQAGDDATARRCLLEALAVWPVGRAVPRRLRRIFDWRAKSTEVMR